MSWTKHSAARRAVVLATLEEAAKIAPPEAAYREAIDLLTAAAEPRKGYRKAYAEQFVIVDGCVQFPLEMLAHDRCLPAREEDGHRMRRAASFRIEGGPVFERIELRRFIVGARDIPNGPRWSSFLWTVRWYGPPEKRFDAICQIDREDLAKGRAPVRR